MCMEAAQVQLQSATSLLSCLYLPALLLLLLRIATWNPTINLACQPEAITTRYPLLLLRQAAWSTTASLAHPTATTQERLLLLLSCDAWRFTALLVNPI